VIVKSGEQKNSVTVKNENSKNGVLGNRRKMTKRMKRI